MSSRSRHSPPSARRDLRQRYASSTSSASSSLVEHDCRPRSSSQTTRLIVEKLSSSMSDVGYPYQSRKILREEIRSFESIDYGTSGVPYRAVPIRYDSGSRRAAERRAQSAGERHREHERYTEHLETRGRSQTDGSLRSAEIEIRPVASEQRSRAVHERDENSREYADVGRESRTIADAPAIVPVSRDFGAIHYATYDSASPSQKINGHAIVSATKTASPRSAATITAPRWETTFPVLHREAAPFPVYRPVQQPPPPPPAPLVVRPKAAREPDKEPRTQKTTYIKIDIEHRPAPGQRASPFLPISVRTGPLIQSTEFGAASDNNATRTLDQPLSIETARSSQLTASPRSVIAKSPSRPPPPPPPTVTYVGGRDSEEREYGTRSTTSTVRATSAYAFDPQDALIVDGFAPPPATIPTTTSISSRMAEVSPRSVHVIDQYELVERIRRFPTPLHQIRPDNELPALDFTPDPNLNSPAITTDLSDDYISGRSTALEIRRSPTVFTGVEQGLSGRIYMYEEIETERRRLDGMPREEPSEVVEISETPKPRPSLEPTSPMAERTSSEKTTTRTSTTPRANGETVKSTTTTTEVRTTKSSSSTTDIGDGAMATARPLSPTSPYQSTISARPGFQRQQHPANTTNTSTYGTTASGGRVLKIVTEMGSSSIGSGLSPFGQNAASTIRDAREREKKEMSDLNDRLANYIEKVRFLEAQNRKLAADLDLLKSRWGKDTSSIRQMYESELTEARKLIEDSNKQRGDLENQIRKLQEELAEYRRKYEEAQRGRGADREKIDELLHQLANIESELNLLRRRIANLEEEVTRMKKENHRLISELQRARMELDQETLNRIDYQNQVQTLLEEIDFLRRVHDQEIKELQGIAARDTTQENREFFKNELASAIRDIRAEYDQTANVNRTDMESWYKLKVQEIQTQSTRQTMEHGYQKEEVKRLRTQLTDLRSKLADLEGRNALLEQQVQQLNYQLEDDQRSYEAGLNDRDAQIRKMREECQALMVELQMLLDTKQTLDAEIAIYRKMLEGEENRAGLRQLVEQVVRTHGIKQDEETESMRIVKGETATRTSFQRSAKGNVSIHETNPEGKFIVLENTHRSKEEPIGEWKLKRKIDGKKEIVYTMPKDFVLRPGKNVKIWARGQGGTANPPDSLVYDGEDSFGTGSNVQTILYSKDGEERATHIQRSSQAITAP